MDPADAAWLEELAASAFRGREKALKLALAAWLAGGHVLIEDVPGVGKTTLAKNLAAACGLNYRRIQGTPDLLPADITGSLVLERVSGKLVFAPGPIFSEVVLFDEINRAHPKTQSALLEAMQERQVSVEGQTYALPDPFLVVATQNPASHIGTYPLPEGQRDRFMVAFSLGYPAPEEEKAMIRAALELSPLSERPEEHANSNEQQVRRARFARLRAQAFKVHLSEALLDYILALVAASRRDPRVALGLSPRAAVQIARLAQAWALLAGRSFGVPDDVQAIFAAAACHRLQLADEAERSEQLVQQWLCETPIP